MTDAPSNPTPSGSEKTTVTPKPKKWWWWLQKLIAPVLILAVGLLLIVLVGVAQRVGWISAGGPTAVDAGGDAQQIYTCPMHPQIRQPGPGRCPICGMALVPATAAGGADLDELSVKIEPAQRRLANIQTAEARRETVVDTIETIGALAIDESRMATIASYIDGRLERLFADYTGVDVARGDHLAVIYSPQLYSAQVEYLESRRALGDMAGGTLPAVKTAQERLVRNSRQRLVELGMTSEQIDQLAESGEAKSRMTIYSPIGGTVIEKLAVEGKYVAAGEPIYRIADLSTIWLMLELFPEDVARIRFGQRVEAEIQSIPGETFEGRVAFIDPTVDEDKRTVGVRVEFLNEDRRLRPGDYARATISVPIGQTGEVYDADLAGRWISPMHPQVIRDEPGDCPICGMDLVPTTRYGYSEQPVDQPTSLYVPRSALLLAGDNSVVYVETEPGKFEIRPVTIGPLLRDKVVILKGLKEGEKVATAGNFLIDSQMQLAGKPSLIDPSRAIAKKEERQGPLEFEHVHVSPVAGEAGRELEQLYQNYFTVRRELAADRKPPEQSAATLHKLAAELANEEQIPEAARQQLAKIAGAGEHLHHMDLEKARQAFKPMSHAVVRLATMARGSEAEQPFLHFFCPMVPGGGGDWLQAEDELLNPYWGSKMLRCGSKVEAFPVATPAHADSQGQDTAADSERQEAAADSQRQEAANNTESQE